MRTRISLVAVAALAFGVASSAQALTFLSFPIASNPLELAAGPGDWNYDFSNRTWETASDPFSLSASTSTGAGSAYLTVTGVGVGAFDIGVSNEGQGLRLVAEGTNQGTYFQVYTVEFDSPVSSVFGGTSSNRYHEQIAVVIRSLGRDIKSLNFAIQHIRNGIGSFINVKKKPRDAGYVPEPGAVGVFSIGLLVAGALIRRAGRKD